LSQWVAAREPPVFVVELPAVPALAFAAEDEAQATSFSFAAWFKDALDNHLCAKKAGATRLDSPPRIRSATKEEERIYRNFAREFVDISDCFLFAPVSQTD
jgi:hypothetical protein